MRRPYRTGINCFCAFKITGFRVAEAGLWVTSCLLPSGECVSVCGEPILKEIDTLTKLTAVYRAIGKHQLSYPLTCCTWNETRLIRDHTECPPFRLPAVILHCRIDERVQAYPFLLSLNALGSGVTRYSIRYPCIMLSLQRFTGKQKRQMFGQASDEFE